MKQVNEVIKYMSAEFLKVGFLTKNKLSKLLYLYSIKSKQNISFSQSNSYVETFIRKEGVLYTKSERDLFGNKMNILKLHHEFPFDSKIDARSKKEIDLIISKVKNMSYIDLNNLIEEEKLTHENNMK